MKTRWWIHIAAVFGLFGHAYAQCPQGTGFIDLNIEDGARIMDLGEVRIGIVAHDYDKLRISVDDQLMEVIQRTALTDARGPRATVTRTIGPRKADARITIGESQRNLIVQSFSGATCKSEKMVSLFGGDSRLVAIVVGISTYESVTPLMYARKDAEAFAKMLKETVTPAEDLWVRPFYDSMATKANVEDAIVQAAENASRQGIVLIYFSGHGSLGQVVGKVGTYFVPWNAKANKPPLFISHKQVLEDFLQPSLARLKIVISDACNSGVSLESAFGAPPKSRAKSLVVVEDTQLQRLAKEQKRQWTHMPTEVLWFASSQGTEVSYELEGMSNGIFTTYLLRSSEGGRTYRDRKAFIVRMIHDAHQGVTQTPYLHGSDDLMNMDFPFGSMP